MRPSSSANRRYLAVCLLTTVVSFAWALCLVLRPALLGLVRGRVPGGVEAARSQR